MLRFQPVLLLAAAAVTSGTLLPAVGHAQNAAELAGQIEGRQYVSPTGQFRVAIPVRPEFGGAITDTPTVVTFHDDLTTHVSIGAFQQDAMQRRELSTRGLKEYLAYYFATQVLPAFQGARSDMTAKYLPGTMEGALLAFFELPGRSVFASRMPNFGLEPPAAKRGNLVFVRNGYVFVLSMELAERVTEGLAYQKTPAEEEEVLRTRLLAIVERMTFPPAPAKEKEGAGK